MAPPIGLILGDGGKVVRRNLRSRSQPDFHDAVEIERRAKRLRCAIENLLLAFRPLQLDEDTFVLDGAQDV